MNKKYRKVIICVVMLGLLFSGTSAYAWSFHRDSEKGEKRMGGKMDGLVKELGLTPEQEEQIKSFKSGQREATKALKEEIQSKRTELRTELEKVDTDRAKVDSIVAKIKDLMGQKLDGMVEGVLLMKETLTPEQYEKFRNKIGKHKGKDEACHDGKEKKHGKGFKR
ncbi:MAG: Spy/CpxP family protein refolding chaperone [Candidatus Omnitrophica bacterium]|nr:Spy/CpxP family protein refolding chaperone [Candidatus Omnitrophota bacterium]